MPMLEEAREEAGLAYDALDLIMVTIGPGTFTGVRVGLAAARGLSLACDCPVQGVGTLAALACAVDEPGAVLASIDARRGELYWQRFAADSRPETIPRLGTIDAAVAAQDGVQGRLVGTGSGIMSERLPSWIASAAPALPDAASIALHRQRFGPADPDRPPAPLYLRAPDAKLPT